MEKKEKLSFKETVGNAWYALALGTSISKSIVIHSFFLWLAGYCEWVFFDGIFMRKIVEGLDKGIGFRPIFMFILISGAVFCTCSIYSNYVENIVYPLETNRLFGGIYRKMYEKARNVELRCYEDSDFYNRYTMAMDGAEEKVTAIIRGILGTVIGSVSAVIVFWFMYEIDHFAILFILSPLVGNFVFGNLKNKIEFKRYQEQAPNEKVLNYVSRMMYLPDGAKEIRLSKVFSLMKKQYKDATDRNVEIAKKYAFSSAHMDFWRITFTFTVIFEGVLLYAIYRKQVTGSITLAQLTIMTSLMVAMTWILIRVFENILEVMKNAVFINNLRNFLSYEEKIPQDQDGIIPDKAFETLEFRNVSFSYQDEATIKNLSFVIKKDQTVALVGHNGAGKTTFVKLLMRLYDVKSGSILADGIDIRDYNVKQYRNTIGTVFQDFQIFAGNVRENVILDVANNKDFSNSGYEYDTNIRQALSDSGLLKRVDRLKNGLDTELTTEFSKDGVNLSGGESQKLAIARVFYKDAGLMILDEPSSALDPIAEYQLNHAMLEATKDKTVVFISHRLSTTRLADRIVMLENGCIVEQGSHEELLTKNGKYAEMWRVQAGAYIAV